MDKRESEFLDWYAKLIKRFPKEPAFRPAVYAICDVTGDPNWCAWYWPKRTRLLAEIVDIADMILGTEEVSTSWHEE